jgi:EmrB/QacA subfamily drug resistance transporter
MAFPAAASSLTHREILKIFSGLMVAMFLGALNQTIVSTAGPTIVGELGDLNTLPWLFTAFMLTSTASVPLYGKLSDHYGRRLLLQIAVWIFVAGSIGVGLAQDVPQLVLGRAVQGLGAGGLVPLSLTVIGDILPPRARGKYNGYITSVFAVASVMGPLAGGFFIDQMSWRWAFHINVPLAILAILIIRRNLPSSPRAGRARIDYWGAALLTMALTSLLVIGVLVETQGIVSLFTAGFTLVAIGSLVALLWVERRAPEPLVPLELFADPVFRVAAALGFLLSLSMFGALVFLPLFLQVSQGLSATASGLSMVPMMGCLTIASLVAGRVATHVGRYRTTAIVGCGLVLVAMGGLTTVRVDTPVVLIAVLVGLLGAGIGTGMPVMNTAIQNAAPPHHLGAATSLAHFGRTTGGIVGVSIFGAVLTTSVARGLRDTGLAGTDAADVIADPGRVAALAEPTRAAVRSTLADGVGIVIIVAAALAVVAFVLSFALRDAELADSFEVEDEEDDEQQPAAGEPVDTEAQDTWSTKDLGEPKPPR